MVKLSINLNKIAMLRNQRDSGIPSITLAGIEVIAAGAHGLTVHPRPDERHIRKSDIGDLKALWQNGKLTEAIEYNIEGYPSAEWLELVRKVRPTQATLVPDAPQARTSDDGWDAMAQGDFLRDIIADLQDLGIRTSLFLNPCEAQVVAAKNCGSDRLEFYTGPYAENFAADKEAAVAPYIKAAQKAAEIGIGVNAGHDLNLQNLTYFAEHIDNLQEVSIGHAFTADALWMGLEQATKAYLKALIK